MGSLGILIVDDHEAVRRSVRSLLSLHAGWSVCGEAVDGLDAIEKARSLRPDVVLMDLSMPRMDGIEATRILRRELPESEIIVLSQDDAAILRSHAGEVNARYICKSDLSRDLIATLNKVAQERNSEHAKQCRPLLTSTNHSQPGQTDRRAVDKPEGLQASHGLKTGTRLPWLKGSGEMVGLIRNRDWSETPIGAAEAWSPALRMMVGFLVANRFPLLLWWGPQYISIYNDACRPVLGTKHPQALGLPVSECWSEIWHILQPLIDTPFKGGPATWMEDLELEIRRSGFTEETHFTVASSPVPDATVPGGIGGVLATVHEITEKIVSERRVSILAGLSARAMEAKTAERACTVAAKVLSANSKDVPFALIYLIDRKDDKATLAGIAGSATGAAISPLVIDLVESAGARCGWPLKELLRTEQLLVREKLGAQFADVPSGPWSEPPGSAVLVPIRSNREHDLAGVLIAGVSSRLALDTQYRSFFELVAAQIATAIANARAYEDERKRAEALAEIDRAKTEFFSNVSHEFRTPLTLMLGPLEDLMSKGRESAGPEQAQLEVIHRNGLRLLKLVNTLLDFSRIEAERPHASFVETDLAATTGELASVFTSAMEKAGLKYTIDCPPLPESIFIDRDMWEKIVFNLLSNAFKFTPTGEVKVTLRAQPGEAVLSIRDTGIGIPRWELDNVFKRFHRIENAGARTQEGTGIGLALAQELVKLHGGRINVESKMGSGSTFHVHIPFGKGHLPAEHVGSERPYASTALRAEAFVDEALTWLPAEAREKSVEEPAPPSEDSPSQRAERPRVLLAEDNADMRDYVRRLLSPAYTVETVGTGAAALEAARRTPPALILSDIMMPEMNGLELVQHLRAEERFSHVPIILLSARAGEDARIEGVGHGADDYLTKPFSARELMARVSAHLDLARLRQQTEEALRKNEERFRTLSESLEAEVQARTAELEQRNAEVVEQSDQLRELSKRLLQAQDEERRHIARELHDSAGQTLAALAMNLASMTLYGAKNPLLGQALDDSQNLVHQLTKEIRTTSYLLHPPLLDEGGLPEALRWYLQGLMERSGLTIELEIAKQFGRLPREMEMGVFRIVQEGLTNILRHSGSKTAMVRLCRSVGNVALEIQDEGKGIPGEKLDGIHVHSSGVGITGMRERVRHFKGGMHIQSDNTGTTISIRLPIPAADSSAAENVIPVEAAELEG